MLSPFFTRSGCPLGTQIRIEVSKTVGKYAISVTLDPHSYRHRIELKGATLILYKKPEGRYHLPGIHCIMNLVGFPGNTHVVKLIIQTQTLLMNPSTQL